MLSTLNKIGYRPRDPHGQGYYISSFSEGELLSKDLSINGHLFEIQ